MGSLTELFKHPEAPTRRKYTHPPVTEAVIDIRVTPDAPVDYGALQEIFDSSEQRLYPVRRTHMAGSIAFDPSTGTATPSPQRLTGYRFISASESEIAQFREDGFTFSKLPPYDAWEPFRDEAKRLWQKYVHVIKSGKVTQLGVRYINKIDIASGEVRITDYVVARPEVPAGFPQKAGDFLLRIQCPNFDDLNTSLIFHEGRAPGEVENQNSLVLDFDVFRPISIPCDSDSIWDVLAELHEYENRFFESCITDKAREGFLK